jgi:hypothetical protein
MKISTNPISGAAIPRLVPSEPLPPYSYVTGQFPHPLRDPAGHSFGVETKSCPAPDPNRWANCQPYLYGLDLFNHGYYWEAHEAWETVWHAAGRTGPIGDFIKGLIKLAAAGVKAREGRPEGVRAHARRAAELFSGVQRQLGPQQTSLFGLSLLCLIELAHDVAREPPKSCAPKQSPVEIVFPFILWPVQLPSLKP